MAPTSVTIRPYDHLASVLVGDLLSHSYNITFSLFLYKCFVSRPFTFLVATTVSAIVDEGTVGYIKVQHSWKE